MYDLIIIGGGPAGLTAAVYAIRKRLNCLLISPDLGGKANRPHEHRRRGYASGHKRRTTWCAVSATRSNIWISPACWSGCGGSGTDRESTLRHDRRAASKLEARRVILATGADAVRLGVPGADRYFLRGVAYSTVSYAPLYHRTRRVALVGAGAMALAGGGRTGADREATLSGCADARRAGQPAGSPAAGMPST